MEAPAKRVALADTNLFIALFAGPLHSSHERALQLFRRVAYGELVLIVTPVIVGELVYGAFRLLGWDRVEASQRLAAVLQAEGISVREQPALLAALDLYGRHPKLDFPDAYLAAHALDTATSVASFDRDYEAVEGVDIIAA